MFDNFFKKMVHRAIAAVLFFPALLIAVAALGWLLDMLYVMLAPIVPVLIVPAFLIGGVYAVIFRRRRL